MQEWGIFNDESADYTEKEAVEAGFYSKGEAMSAIEERYDLEDDLHVHEIEEEDYDDDDPDDTDQFKRDIVPNKK